ncbi:hypothetical protein SVIOM74S_09219 [Streptomyces violarus]
MPIAMADRAGGRCVRRADRAPRARAAGCAVPARAAGNRRQGAPGRDSICRWPADAAAVSPPRLSWSWHHCRALWRPARARRTPRTRGAGHHVEGVRDAQCRRAAAPVGPGCPRSAVREPGCRPGRRAPRGRAARGRDDRRHRSGRSAAATRAAPAPVLAPNRTTGRRWCRATVPASRWRPTSLRPSKGMSKRSSAVRTSSRSSSSVSRSISRVPSPPCRRPGDLAVAGLQLPPCANSTTARAADGTVSERGAVGGRGPVSEIIGGLLSRGPSFGAAVAGFFRPRHALRQPSRLRHGAICGTRVVDVPPRAGGEA